MPGAKSVTNPECRTSRAVSAGMRLLSLIVSMACSGTGWWGPYERTQAGVLWRSPPAGAGRHGASPAAGQRVICDGEEDEQRRCLRAGHRSRDRLEE
jgi:hypothetical protein